ncbi:MAG TPA: isoprenylcysteine carboxylmethyltransferase family protein [Verrucomicrobiota bacterium]|nr:isoprenylcysteine carboxylmethyltransferase family protein [Verrucomicrobiota bacterium]
MVLILGLAPVTEGTTPIPAARTAAWVLFILGAVPGIGGAAVLRNNRTIFPHPREGSQLVQHGVYRWIRHPLYTSLMVLATGWSLFWHSWPAGFMTVILVGFLNLKARHEESLLRAVFPAYGTYCDRVKRFIPGVF